MSAAKNIWTGFVYRALIGEILIMIATSLFAQISPGKLSDAHAHLEGLSNCTKCHLLGEKVAREKCLDCHTAIASRVKEQRGYHASSAVREKECSQCHSEHHGREFQMIRFDPGDFDHLQTGYTLEGAHAEAACRSCHKPGFIQDPHIRERSSTYLGLERSCVSCHTDRHQGTLASDCSYCHDFKAFAPASKFDHGRTRFPLVGQHLEVECTECHRKTLHDGTEIQEFAGVPYANCTSCHRDVHDNRFGQNCIQCHTEESFHRIRQTGNFQHSMTHYPLEGKHRSVSCANCHKTRYTDPLKHELCLDCHTDYHNGQFARPDSPPDCSGCHTTLGFERSYYTIERHNQATFVLKGAHLATPCFACHKKTDRWSFREIGKGCVDCHNNVHEDYLDPKYSHEAGCEACHSSSSWQEIGFDHSKTKFPLEGVHLKQSCRSCHWRTDQSGKPSQVFSELSPACITCHRDVHSGQFGETDGIYCLRCHGYGDWSAGRFDHNRAAFRLTGKHREVACEKCHKPVVTAQYEYTQYKLTDFSCEACH